LRNHSAQKDDKDVPPVVLNSFSGSEHASPTNDESHIVEPHIDQETKNEVNAKYRELMRKESRKAAKKGGKKQRIANK
jgi:hypothetical protein